MTDVFDWFAHVPPVMEFVILLSAFAGAVFALYKGVYRPIKGHFDKINAGMDTLLGYPPVLDPGSGREIQAATPPLAQRVYDLEATNKQVADALTTLAETQRTVVSLQEELGERDKRGMQIIEEWTTWREQHEDEAKVRQTSIDEWHAWRSEQALLWEMVRTHMGIEQAKE